MNEILAKRLLGACVLVGVTLVLAKLLPAPQTVPPPEEHAKRVTYDLRPQVEVAKIEPAPVTTANPEPSSEPETPPSADAPTPQDAAPSPAPVAETPPPPAPAKPVVAKPLASKPAAAKAAPVKPKAAPSPKPVEVAAAPAPESAAAEPSKQAWFLQIGAYAYQANAAKSVDKLRKAGLQPREDTITMKAGKRYRVRCGPFATQQQAEEEKAKAVQIGFADARVARD